MGAENIKADLRPLARPIADLKEDPENLHIHNDQNLKAIMGSLAAFGQQRVIVARSDGVVIAGNGTLLAARRLEWEQLAVVVFDKDDPKLAELYAITDNRTSELSEWDYGFLPGQLRELHDAGFNLRSIGWPQRDVEPMLQGGDWKPAERGPLPAAPHHNYIAPLAVTVLQRAKIDPAIAAIREMHENAEMSEGRCIEFLCLEYLAN